MGDAATTTKDGGVDRTHGPGGLARHAFFALHALSLGLCAWIVFGEGLNTLGALFGSSWPMAAPLRAQLMFAVTALYFVRHGVTLYYLLMRKVTWSEGMGLGAFMIVQEVGYCLLAAGIISASPPPVGWLDGLAIGLVLIGSYLNTGSEVQRKWWKAHPENKGKCYTGGLFAHAMHINYFGDVVSVLGWSLLTMTWWTVFLPLLITGMFIFMHIPRLDRYLAERYGEPFEQYAKKTKKLIPFIY
jgi:protein-S-isoprenylcysteine O-methyltransferase Ste14